MTEPDRPDTPASAGDDLLASVYDELRSAASAHLHRERAGHTLQATELVHEAWLRVRRYDNITLKGRSHFLALASQAMRRVLIDYARRRLAAKRDGGICEIELPDDFGAMTGETFLAFDRALAGLAEVDAETARMIEQRYFGGASTVEIAEYFGVTDRTVRNRLAYGRTWLYDALGMG